MSYFSIEFHPEAIVEARETVRWYAYKSAAAAEAFISEIDLAVSVVQEDPLIRADFIPGLKRYLFQQFPYAMVYRVKNSIIQVVAFAHARRKPNYWKTRVT